MTAQKNDFSVGSVKKHIINQAVPLTMALLVHLLYNIVDRIYIGHLPENGDLALTGLGITFPIVVIISAFTALFGTGGTPLFSIARGQKDDEEAERLIGNVFALLSVTAVILMILCYFFRRPVLFLFGASEVSYYYADEYLKIYLLGTFFSMITTGLNTYINAQGFPKVGMMTTVIGAVINIVLDPIFIFLLDMGVQGAALATVISQGVSALWVLKFLTGKKAILRLKKEYIRINGARTRRIASLGITGFVMSANSSLVQIACNNQLQLYGGDLYVGIMTIINSVREIMSLAMNGISNGSQPVSGYNYGAGKYDRVKESIRFIAVTGLAYTMVIWIIVMLIPEQLISIFTSDPETITIGAHMINIYFFGFVFMSFQFVGQCTFQALGKAKQAIFFSIFRKVIIVVPLTFLLPALGFGVDGVFLAEPISNAVGGLASFLTMWFTLYRKL
ncbi:MAG: MATE family efflux transporter [Clostridiales bacterium]|nr:MATE family efflux transporter [Clostridiales bacterium]